MRAIPLEPISPFAFLVSGVHLAAGALLWWCVHQIKPSLPDTTATTLVWMSPADFTNLAPTSPLAAASLSQEPATKPEASTPPKAIALTSLQAAMIMARSRSAEAAAAKPSSLRSGNASMASLPALPSLPTLPALPPRGMNSFVDMAAQNAVGGIPTFDLFGTRLDDVDRAIIRAFLQEWHRPGTMKASKQQRTAHLNITVDRDGKVVETRLSQPSGNLVLDKSVLEAARRLEKLEKIELEFPEDYAKDRYEFHFNFHAE